MNAATEREDGGELNRPASRGRRWNASHPRSWQRAAGGGVHSMETISGTNSPSRLYPCAPSRPPGGTTLTPPRYVHTRALLLNLMLIATRSNFSNKSAVAIQLQLISLIILLFPEKRKKHAPSLYGNLLIIVTRIMQPFLQWKHPVRVHPHKKSVHPPEEAWKYINEGFYDDYTDTYNSNNIAS